MSKVSQENRHPLLSAEEYEDHACDIYFTDGSSLKSKFYDFKDILMINIRYSEIYMADGTKEMYSTPMTVCKDLVLEGRNYELLSMILFTGPVWGGHYMTVTRRDTAWYLMDDGSIFLVTSIDEFLKDNCFIRFLLYQRR